MKGISPIIAAVLLVAFTVAVGGILSVWSTTLTTTQTQTIGNQTGGQIVCAPALVIDEVKVPPVATGGSVNVTFHNAGNQQITNIKVWARTTTGIVSASAPNIATGEIFVGNVSTLSINGTLNLVRVTGTCADTITVLAECTTADKCWKAT